MKVNPNSIVFRTAYTFDGNNVQYRDRFTYADAKRFEQDMIDVGAEDTSVFEIRLCDSYLYDRVKEEQ